jgi:hypothetical protein
MSLNLRIPPKITHGDPPHVLAPPMLVIQALGIPRGFRHRRVFGCHLFTFQSSFMAKILGLKLQNRKSDGRPMIIVQANDRVAPHWVSFAQWLGHGYSEVLDAYVGGEFHPDYFKKGDELLSGDIVDVDDIILRDFVASMSENVTAKLALGALQVKTEAAKDAAELFRMRRAAETPEQAQARRDAAKAAREERAKVDTPAKLQQA